MNIVGRIFGFGASLQDSNTPELVKLSSGQLFLVRPGDARTPRECLYNDAMATVRKAQSVEHNFQLVVTRVYEEGEEDILDDEEENSERVFLIGEELEFRVSVSEGLPSLVWRDLAGGDGELYEFVATNTNDATIELFAQCMYRAMFERKYRRSSDEASPKDLQEFVVKPKESTKKPKASTSRVASSSSSSARDESSLSHAMNSLTVADKTTPKSPPKPTYPAKISQSAELYLWEDEEGHFLKQADVIGSINSRTAPYDYWITATSEEGQQFLSHKITSELNARWSAKLSSVTWNYTSSQGHLSSWCLKFDGPEQYKEFQDMYSLCLYEHGNTASWEKAKPDEKAYLMSSLESEDIEMGEADSDDEDAVESVLGASATEESESESEPEDNDEPSSSMPLGEKGDRNSQLAVGYGRNNRTFVMRGDKIGVFNHTDEGKVEYAATIKDLGFKKMKNFKPKHMMLHDRDKKMILMNPLQEHSLFAVDIEYGKIVEEWKVDDNITVNNIAPNSKFAQTTGEQTLVGTSGNAIFRIDPRLGGKGGNTMADSKQYTTKNKFSGVTTTTDGKLAVVSEKGDIRLFDTVGKIAKTALPAMGDPIIGVDVSSNGRWIVATCKTYLFVIDTLIGDGKYAGSLGFDRAFPADSKPQPKRLQLRPEHAAHMDHDISFTPARFNIGEGQEENAIVTSTGRYVIAWDFSKVKKNKLDGYVIKKYEDDVVQDNFRFGDDKEIVVALANDVLAINKKQLKRLPRASLTTPAKQLKSRSSIVNSPY
ncbi:VID27-domain-containing protein [Schizopora paradoxa]|uniref:VID27-domain-containing protein n=1 Tax=Schizopora paradoxa TaxID=27342 RepID=A0A0H2R8V4_9AGAM|nr:VID27-domain-containing protein [Schizopora paradoxa]